MWKIVVWRWIQHYKVLFILQCVLSNNSFGSKIVQIKRSGETVDTKYILLWKPKGFLKNILGEGKEIFQQNHCPVHNCFVTSDRQKFGEDMRKFDAILFSGWDQNWYIRDDLPDKRYNHQKYAYVHRTSAARAYVCHKGFDNFFNWTITYKLDSDIVFPHIHIKNNYSKVIGPKKDIKWINYISKVNETFMKTLANKTKTVAWFNSKCKSSSVNRKFVESLQKALNKYNLSIDIYGKCGPLNCSSYECHKMLKKKYYFYLSLEDSVADDYVTGNILKPLHFNTVPVVYGGANYSRFLPPHSYLDGTSQTPEELAASMSSLIKNQTLYGQYFWWRSHYRFSTGLASLSLLAEEKFYCGHAMCSLCKALHDPNKYKRHSVYADFRKWWYPDYKDKCPKWRTPVFSSAKEQTEEDKLMGNTEEKLEKSESLLEIKKKGKSRKKHKNGKKGKKGKANKNNKTDKKGRISKIDKKGMAAKVDKNRKAQNKTATLQPKKSTWKGTDYSKKWSAENAKPSRRIYMYHSFPNYFDHPTFHHPSFSGDFDKRTVRKMKMFLMDKMFSPNTRYSEGTLLRKGGGGGGGGGVRTAGRFAWEWAQIYVTVASNNFLMQKRRKR